MKRVGYSCCVGLSLTLAAMRVMAADADTMPSVPPRPPERVPQTSMGVTQLPNDKLDWMLDAKFGMFIHWGVYSVPASAEWYMEKHGMRPEVYKKFAYPDGDKPYFDANNYHPEEWAQLAKDAGMKWMCLTARHHEGYCLFDSPHPNAFTSMQTLHRDLFGEYVNACRTAGLKVGFYYSPLSWRYPGYYDWTGTNCLPNAFGYKSDPSHLENARLMKEENYVNVKKLLTGYGKIDYIFWDGGWLGLRGKDSDAAFFHEPGQYLDPNNRWPISKEYQDIEPATGKALGIMGMVRRYQPDCITNLRYGWIGDTIEEEGGKPIVGPIRSQEICDKCLTIQPGGWGYNEKSLQKTGVMPLDQIIDYLANCVVRDMVFLANVGPDRHGQIPELEQHRLREVGQWIGKMHEGIYSTRAGPWQPVDGKYGFCYHGDTVYIHLLKGYAGTEFTLHELGNLHMTQITDLYSGSELPHTGDSEIVISNINRTESPADTIIAVKYDGQIESIWKK